jgi:hypothetical protein
MYIQRINTKENERYERNYPLYGNTRLRKITQDRIRKYGRSGQSIDDVVSMLLDILEGKETFGDEKSW